jgi:hypothetical protein
MDEPPTDLIIPYGYNSNVIVPDSAFLSTDWNVIIPDGDYKSLALDSDWLELKIRRYGLNTLLECGLLSRNPAREALAFTSN